MCVKPTGVTTDTSQLLNPQTATMEGRVLPPARREIEVRSLDEWESSVSGKKAHVVHQIGNNFTTKSHRMFKISCEQQDVPAHDTNDPLRQPCIGTESNSFVCVDRKVIGGTTVCGPMRELPHLCSCWPCQSLHCLCQPMQISLPP